MKFLVIIITVSLLFSCSNPQINLEDFQSDLIFDSLANRWDEAIPLGNGMLGVLIWQNKNKLRLSLDRSDLWDLRPMKNLDLPEWNYKWVYDQWKNNSYKNVQDKFDAPYDQMPAPTKIPAGAIEFDIQALGKLKEVHLYVKNAVCKVEWENGANLLVFVHADKNVGWYRFENVKDKIYSKIIPPPYGHDKEGGDENPVKGQALNRLGYKPGIVSTTNNSSTYSQKGWGGFKYKIYNYWKKENNTLTGCWSISSEIPTFNIPNDAVQIVHNNFQSTFQSAMQSHKEWWKEYWDKSNISIPDELLQNQWYLDMYKFGSTARKGAPPISLQGVWTADNGRIPPWKGDFHHDLNTQLSYWPAYSGNHLEIEEGFLDWLWKYKSTFEKYTREYFQTKGLNVPGVTTLNGAPMGGWIQYSFGPTVSAWLAQHFYLHWRYTMDKQFLKERAYPWIKEVAIFLDDLSVVSKKTGLKKLPISSSPEIFNNSRKAWFGETTNFDLALIRWTFSKASELAQEIGLEDEAKKWNRKLSDWPNFAIDNEEGLMFSPNVHYSESHRHFSHLMAIHPLGIIDWNQGIKSQNIIINTLQNLENKGSDFWTGYSFSWLGNLYARTFNGNKAASTLRIFSKCFCLKNSFHVNGDQCDAGHSTFHYRPFTLEGNFAFAAALQEMLIQSHTGVVYLFPSLPDEWTNVSFNKLRTEGAFLISAIMNNASVSEVLIKSTMGGTILLKNPFRRRNYKQNDKIIEGKEIIKIKFNKDETIKLRAISN